MIGVTLLSFGLLPTELGHTVQRLVHLSLAVEAALLGLLNYRAKVLLAERYKISGTGWHWRSPEFKDYQVETLMKYLKEQGLLSERKVRFLIDILGKEVDLLRIPEYVAPGVLLALFLTAWARFMDAAFKGVESIEHAWLGLVLLPVIVYFIIYLMGMVKGLLSEVRDTVSPSKERQIKDLVHLLGQCLIMIPECSPVVKTPPAQCPYGQQAFLRKLRVRGLVHDKR